MGKTFTCDVGGMKTNIASVDAVEAHAWSVP